MKLGPEEKRTIVFDKNICDRNKCLGSMSVDVTIYPNKSRFGDRFRIANFTGSAACETCGLDVENAADGANLLDVSKQLDHFVSTVAGAVRYGEPQEADVSIFCMLPGERGELGPTAADPPLSQLIKQGF